LAVYRLGSLAKIQVICTGDFCQLPPVQLLSELRYAFSGEFWNSLFGEHQYVLTKVFRQGGDMRLLRILREVREGFLSAESAKILLTECRPQVNEPDMPKIFSLKKDVQLSNEQSLGSLPGDLWCSKSIDSGVTKILEDLLVPSKLSLKIGAIVMYLRNDERKGLCNGSLGRVVGFVGGSPSILYQI
jgi:ATP-dependent DNA helicase PIF1